MAEMVLTQLLVLPLVGLLVTLCLPKRAVRAIRVVATLATGLACLVSLNVLAAFQPALGAMQFEEQLSWIPQMHIAYHLGVDGISLPMVVLTGLLSLLACIASWSITERVKEYFVLYQLLVLGMFGTFLSLDLFLFYIFWEVVLVPMYFLIGIWGSGRREYSAFKFFVYTLTGSLAMLLGILAVYLRTQTFDLLELARAGHTFDLGFQQIMFVAFFLGFAIKVPVFPFHTWLPDAHVDAPTPISVLLAGILLKMGGYGFFRISYPLFPDGAQWFSVGMAALGMINIVYGAFVAMAQTDFKRVVAYSSVSHMGFVLLGLASFTSEGMNGALLQMFSHGAITGGLFLLVGVLYDRAHTRDLNAFGGLGVTVPVYAGLLAVFCLASLGLPGLSGFVAEFMTLVGTFGAQPLLTGVSMVGIVVTAAYTLTVIQKVLLGPLNPKWAALPDVTVCDIVTLAPLAAVTLAVGVYPILVLGVQGPSVELLLHHLEPLTTAWH